MSHWLHLFVANINYFTVPIGMFLGLFSVIVGLYTRKKRREGATQPYIPRPVMLGSILLVLAACVMLGIVIAQNAS